jgi:hypothetical protein
MLKSNINFYRCDKKMILNTGLIMVLLILGILVILNYERNSSNEANIVTEFDNRKLRVIYKNHKKLSFGEYKIKSLLVNNIQLEIQENSTAERISREIISSLDTNSLNYIVVEIG